MLEPRTRALIARIGEDRADDRMRVHACLAIASLCVAGIGLQLGQDWLWMPLVALAGYSVVRFWDHRARWKAADAWEREMAAQSSSKSFSAAGGTSQVEESTSGWPSTGGFRPPSREEAP